jgi:hypothetical protein
MQFNPNTSHYASAVGAWLDSNFRDQFTITTAFLEKLKQRGGFKRGAAYLVQPVFGTGNPSVAGVTNFNNPMSIPADTGLAAVYTWSWYQGLTTVNDQEAAAINTEYEMVDLLEERLRSTVAQFGQVISNDLFSATDASLGKIAGIPYAVDRPTSTANSFGGISRSNTTNPWWRAVVIDAGSQPLTLQRLAIAYNQATENGGISPDIIVMPTAHFSAFESLLLATQQYRQDDELARAGFIGYLFKGATVLFDPRVPNNTIFILNSRDIMLVSQTERPTAEPVQFPDRLVRGYKHGWAVALVAKRLNSNARINNITT